MPEFPPGKYHEHPGKRDLDVTAPRPKPGSAAAAGDKAEAQGPNLAPSAPSCLRASVPPCLPPRHKYAELHCLSNFSFLRGASHPDELVVRAAELGYVAVALTDHNSLAGVVRAHITAKELGIHLIIGAEITPVDAPPIVLLATDRPAYGRLCRLITRGRLRCKKGECEIRLADVAEFCEGMIGIVAGERDAAMQSRGDEGDVQARDRQGDARSAVRPALRIAHAHDASQTGTRLTVAALRRYRELLGPDVYLAATLLHDVPDDERLAELAALARAAGVKLVATNAVHYHTAERRLLQDVLTCVREKCTIHEAGSRLFANAERHLREIPEIYRRYGGRYADIVERTVELAKRCTFSLDEIKYEYPHELVPAGQTATEYLAELTWKGAWQRYGKGELPDPLPPPETWMPEKVYKLVVKELALIAEVKYEFYFLTVWDLVREARARNIFCQGRGSAANSAVCYCLGVTSVNPNLIDVLFERFISRERNEPPDIDIDFEHERREEIFQYIYGKYGKDRAAITAEVVTYRPRSAVRDIAKAMGLSLDRVDQLAKAIDWWVNEAVPAEALHSAGFDPEDRIIRLIIHLVKQVLGFPRHLSQHVGGFVITETPLCEIVPCENGAMPDRVFIEWDKDDIDTAGLLKVDCLSLGMLTAIHKAFDLIRGVGTKGRRDEEKLKKGQSDGSERDVPQSDCMAQGNGSCEGSVSGDGQHAHRRALSSHSLNEAPSGTYSQLGKTLETAPSSLCPCVPSSLSDIPADDPAVYDMMCRADTIGVFQIESRAQMSMLPRLKPRNFYDVVIEVSIVRPGPIQGGMVHPYLRRRQGLEDVSYPSPDVESVLRKTLGVPLFQEQVMQLAVVAAGFTPGEADQLRRAMAAWRKTGHIEKFQVKLMKGMLERGYTPEFAEGIYKQIQGFGEYGFPESHAASFALLVIVSAWLKYYHPAAFCAALLNSQPMGFYAPAQLVRDAIAHGVTVHGPDVNFSGHDCRLENSDEATKRRSDEGEGKSVSPIALNDMMENRDGENVSRSDRVAKIDGSGGADLSHKQHDAEGGAVRADISNEARSIIHSISDRRGTWTSDAARLSSISSQRARVSDGTSNSVFISRAIADDSCSQSPYETPGGSGSHSSGVDSKLGAQTETGSGEELNSRPSSLRRFVAPSLRLGLRLIRGLSEKKTAGIEAEQKRGRITSIRQLARRGDVARDTLLRLAAADAFRSLGLSRREALWEILALDDAPPLFADSLPDESAAVIPPITLPETVVQDYEMLGLSLNAHPVGLVRDELRAMNVITSTELQQTPSRRRVRIAGLVTHRQRPQTAAGIVFMTLEDETGQSNLIVHPRVWERSRRIAGEKNMLIAEGVVERQDEVINVVTHKFYELTPKTFELETTSRDFH